MPRLKKADFGTPDKENPEWTKKDSKNAVPFQKLPASLKTAIRTSVRGRPAGTGKKEAVTISLDSDIVALLRKSGKGWQTRLNDMIRSAISLR
ncbi:MAG: BrnA antitoxin family protein [Alphaproteobacteria bacterium]|nr:BrnA antitoxin family protein [Alphaproteobacteria bacterium]